MDGRRRTLQRTKILSIRLRTNQDGYTGMLLPMKRLSQPNPEESIPLQAPHPHRTLLRDEKEDSV